MTSWASFLGQSWLGRLTVSSPMSQDVGQPMPFNLLYCSTDLSYGVRGWITGLPKQHQWMKRTAGPPGGGVPSL